MLSSSARSARWPKSTFSGGTQGNDCVEVSVSTTGVHIRESDTPDTVVTTTPIHLAALIRRVKTGS